MLGGGHPSPLHRQLGGDPLRASLLQELNDPLEFALVALQVVAESSAKPEVVAQSLLERGHDRTSGHGIAPALSVARSTRAEIAVVRRSRWRSTCPISSSVAPERSIPVAAVCRS